MAKLTTEIFIERAKKIHGDKYDYSKVEYIGAHDKVCIICPIHGEFWQRACAHLRGKGCSKCGIFKCWDKRGRLTRKIFIEKGKLVHGDKYDYSNVKYVDFKTKVCITCPIHGEFWQTPLNHLNRRGCKKCSVDKQKSTNEFFTKKAEIIHNNKYTYSKVSYIDAKTKVCITCPNHGDFWQTPNNHLNGYGCLKCRQSILEKEMELVLLSNNINFESQKRFNWLDKQSLDFYLPDYNIAIECQGIQHFEPVDFANKGENWAKELFEVNIERDERKKKLCEENNIKIFYYSNINIENNEEIINDIDILINKIKENE